MRARILGASVRFLDRPFLVPLRISTGSISEITEARVEALVELGGRQATGRASIYLSDLWAWPDAELSHAARDTAMRKLCERIAAELQAMSGSDPAHPLELGLRLDRSVHALPLDPDPPALARSICASPFDAAIHDAAGLAAGVSAFQLYEEPFPIPSADPLFPRAGAADAIRRAIRPGPLESVAWLVVGQEDSFEDEMRPWVGSRGYRCLKLKLLGRDNKADARHTVRVYRAALGMGASRPRLMADSNCASPDAASVLDYLERLRELDESAFEALEYLEQPTGRDIRLFPNEWRPVCQLKPVFLDEGLADMSTMAVAREQGWSGFALKTCKGHGFSLVAAAWALERDMRLTLQDLTNPGLAAIHALLLASHLPTVNGVELNSPQFTPAANVEWLPRLSSLFSPVDGIHRLRGPVPPGLGSRL